MLTIYQYLNSAIQNESVYAWTTVGNIKKSFFLFECCVAKTVLVLKRRFGRNCPCCTQICKKKSSWDGHVSGQNSISSCSYGVHSRKYRCCCKSIPEYQLIVDRNNSTFVALTWGEFCTMTSDYYLLIRSNCVSSWRLMTTGVVIASQFGSYSNWKWTTVLFKKIIFSDEAHFHVGGCVNKQNCRIWGTENPNFITEELMHSTRVIV